MGTMIQSLWCVIDPTLDRPFFSSEPPADTLSLPPGGRIIRFQWQVPEPSKNEVCHVKSEEEARQLGGEFFAKAVFDASKG